LKLTIIAAAQALAATQAQARKGRQYRRDVDKEAYVSGMQAGSRDDNPWMMPSTGVKQ
jgi:hypothetical protein